MVNLGGGALGFKYKDPIFIGIQDQDAVVIVNGQIGGRGWELLLPGDHAFELSLGAVDFYPRQAFFGGHESAVGKHGKMRRIAAAEKSVNRRRAFPPGKFQIALERVRFQAQGARIYHVQQPVAAHAQIEIRAGDKKSGNLPGAIRRSDPVYQFAVSIIMPHDSIARIGQKDVVFGYRDRRRQGFFVDFIPTAHGLAAGIEYIDVIACTDVDTARVFVLGAADSDYNSYYFGVNEDALNDGDATLSLSYELNKAWSFGGYVQYARLLDGRIREAANTASGYFNHDDMVVCGVHAKYDF